jgi:hypothetical protein
VSCLRTISLALAAPRPVVHLSQQPEDVLPVALLTRNAQRITLLAVSVFDKLLVSNNSNSDKRDDSLGSCVAEAKIRSQLLRMLAALASFNPSLVSYCFSKFSSDLHMQFPCLKSLTIDLHM